MLQDLTSSDQIHPVEGSWEVSYTRIDEGSEGLLWNKLCLNVYQAYEKWECLVSLGSQYEGYGMCAGSINYFCWGFDFWGFFKSR